MPNKAINLHGPALSQSFRTRKSQILANLSQTIPRPSSNLSEYTDKSPKGSVDSQITNLIAEINGYEGFVTTSSCSGRVSVYVEGSSGGDGTGEAELKPTATVGGKGGGRWIYVNHEPIETHRGKDDDDDYHYTKLFGLTPSQPNNSTSIATTKPRLIRLSFEPFILHVMCASLHHAKPLLAAAVSSGFRESGVQSLKNLTDGEVCPMVAVRSAGLGFESVVGIVDDDDGGNGEHEGWEDGDGTSAQDQGAREDRCRAVIGEDMLRLFVGVVNGRFVENERRRNRFMHELRRAMGNEEEVDWEDQAIRRQRKREEGIKAQMRKHIQECLELETKDTSDDVGTMGEEAHIVLAD